MKELLLAPGIFLLCLTLLAAMLPRKKLDEFLGALAVTALVITLAILYFITD